MSKTNAEQANELARNSSDCSFLLTHLIRKKDKDSDEDSRHILEQILDIQSSSSQPMLKASKVGWYGTSDCANVFNPATGNLDGIIQNKAVCFTESTLAGLRAHRDLFEVKYGLAFDRENLFNKGANPCLNISESLLKEKMEFSKDQNPQNSRFIYNFIPSELQPFVNIIHESFDATHEREWRFANDLAFDWSEVRFVFSPENEFHLFSKVQSTAMPCLFDLAWLNRI